MKTRFLLFLLLFSTLATPGHAQWVQTNGPTGSSINAFATLGGNIFAGTYSGGIFRTRDDGSSWTLINMGFAYTRVYALAVMGTNFLAGTSEGVYASTDSGANWSADTAGWPASCSVYALAISGTNIFASTAHNGVFLSTDNGASWTVASSGLPSYATIYSLAVSGGNILQGLRIVVFFFRQTMAQVGHLPIVD